MTGRSYEFNKHPWDKSYGEDIPLDIAINYYKNKLIDRNNRIIRLEEKLEASENARKEAIEFINGTGEMVPYTKSIVMYEQEIEELLDILDIDKGE